MKEEKKILKARLNYFAASLMFAVLAAPGIVHAQEQEEAPAPHCYFANIQTLPIQFDGFQPMIEGSIDGKAITMLVDSGAYDTSLFQHAADRLKLNMVHSGTTSRGVGGETDHYRVHANEIKIGPLRGKNQNVQVIRQYSDDMKEDGLLGADTLFQLDLEMSLADHYLKFYTSSGCEDTPLSYWDENASVVHLDVGTELDASPEIDLLINGKKVRATVDSGAASSIIDLRTAASLGVTPKTPNVVKTDYSVQGIGDAKSDMWIALFDTVTIGDEVIKNVKIEIGNLRGTEMLLGADFLRAHRVLFSRTQSRMYFSYIGGRPFRTSDADDIAWYKIASDKGDANAQYQLGRLYLDSSVVPHDVTQAVSLIQKAAEQGNQRAQVRLGSLFERGEGVAKDPVQAVSWYRKAADSGNLPGQLNLARMYEKGIGVQKDMAQAIGLYKKAAEHDSAYAQARMGVFYLQGKGVPKDEAAGHDWLSRSVKGDKPGRYWSLGQLLLGQGMYSESVSAFQQAVKGEPASEYYGLWLYMAQARAGQEPSAREGLAANKAHWKDDKWPSKIVDFYLGRMTADDLMKSAHDADKKTDIAHTCEANFYTAEHYLITHEAKEAQPLLQAAEHDCPRSFMEYDGAVAELELLNAE